MGELKYAYFAWTAWQVSEPPLQGTDDACSPSKPRKVATAGRAARARSTRAERVGIVGARRAVRSGRDLPTVRVKKMTQAKFAFRI